MSVLVAAMLVVSGIVIAAAPVQAAPGDPAGLYLAPSTEGGVIGSYKANRELRECPADKVLVGVRTENRSNVSPFQANSILTRFDIRCASVAVNNAGAVTVTQDAAWVSYRVDDQSRNNTTDAVCPAGQVVHRMTGTTFVGEAPSTRWPSQVQISCRPLVISPAGQMRVNLSATATVLTSGTNFNATGGVQTPAYQCGSSATTGFDNSIVRGYRPQTGGEGIDGFNPSCSIIPRDFGDAPATYGSASHELNAATYLGWSADPETAQQPSANATADDLPGGTAPNQSIDDENGASSFGPIVAGITNNYSVQVLTSNKNAAQNGQLVGWIDFNQDGTFETGEAATTPVPSGTADGSELTLTWTGVAAQTVGHPGATFARIRVSTDAALTTATPTGDVSNGEVEDYRITVAGVPIVCNQVYGIDQTAGTHNLWAINTATGALTKAASLDVAGSLNGLAVDGASNSAFATSQLADQTGATIYRINPVTGAVQSFPGAPIATPAGGGGVVMGAYSTTADIYYYGVVSNSVLYIYGFDAATNTAINGVIARVSLGTGNNGDFAFDGQGRLYIVSAGLLLQVDQAIPTSGTAAGPLLTTSSIADPPGGSIGSVAFGADGYLYLGAIVDGTRVMYKVNPSTGALLETRTMTPTTNTIGDFASCASPNVIRVQKNLPTGRNVASDQFNLSVTGGGLNRGNTGLTAGSETGVQNQQPAEMAGPVLGLVGQTYTITETGAGSTDVGPYAKTWVCVNTSDDDAEVARGTGSTGTFTMPAATDGLAPDVLCTFTNVAPRPALTLDKTVSSVVDANDNGITDAGDEINYAFELTNAGNVALTGLAVNDSLLAGLGITVTCASTTLAVGASVTCVANDPYVITNADVDAGSVVNTATATGTPPTGPPTRTPADQTETPTEPEPALALEKSVSSVVDVNGNGITDVGDQINFEFKLTNTGNVTLTALKVDDPMLAGLGTAIVCAPNTLAVAASVTCLPAAPYVITQADVDAGSVVNTATATGTPPNGPPSTTPPDTSTTPTDPTPAINLVKIVNTNELVAGETATYTFVARNTGNTTLTDVTIAETAFTGSGTMSALTCAPAQPATLAPGAELECSATYVITPTDVDAGTLENAAEVTGTPPTGPPVTSEDGVTVPSDPSPALSLNKTASSVVDANDNGIADVGDEINYSFLLRNTGNVTLTDLKVTDPLLAGLGIAITCAPDTLAAGASVTCVADAPYVITAADVDAGTVVNTATAEGTPPTGPPTDTPSDQTETPLPPAPGLTLDKTASSVVDANDNDITDAGDEITYEFLLTNTGNVTLTGLKVTDPLLAGLGIAITCAPDTLAAGASVTCVAAAPYVITPADVDAGSVVNSATAEGTPPTGPPTGTPSDETETPLPSAPSLTLNKTSVLVDVNDNGVADVGDEINYSFSLTNTGNVTLTDLEVADPLLAGLGIAIVCDPDTLAAGASVICVADAPYVITAADVDAGSVVNSATAEGTPPTGPPTTTPPDENETPLPPAPGLTLNKTSVLVDVNGNDVADAGDEINYSFLLTNIGNSTLTGLEVNDPLLAGLGIAIVCDPDMLAAGASVTCVADAPYVITAADVDAGSVVNSATAQGTPPTGPPTTTPPDENETPLPPAPGLTLDKTASAVVDVNDNKITDAGDQINYAFKLTNIGNVTLTDLKVNDPLLAGLGIQITCAPSTLAAGASVTCTADSPYVITKADADAGSVVNEATGTGTPPTGPPTNTPSDETETPVPPAPGLALDKSVSSTTDVNDNDVIDAGDEMEYSFLLTNTGNVTLTDVTVSDPKLAALGITTTCAPNTLAAGASVTCTADAPYIVTKADERAGSVVNTATGTGTPPTGPPTVTPPDTVNTPIGGKSPSSVDEGDTTEGLIDQILPNTGMGQAVLFAGVAGLLMILIGGWFASNGRRDESTEHAHS